MRSLFPLAFGTCSLLLLPALLVSSLCNLRNLWIVVLRRCALRGFESCRESAAEDQTIDGFAGFKSISYCQQTLPRSGQKDVV